MTTLGAHYPSEGTLRQRILRSTALAAFLSAFATLPALAATTMAAPPSSGTIQKQTTPRPALPTAPKAILKFPGRKMKKPVSKVKIPVKKIIFQGNHEVSTASLEQQVQPIVGKTVTLARLKTAAQDITIFYHQKGYPLAYAYLPPQKVKHGVIKIALVEPTYDQIKLHNHSRLKTAQARRTLGLRSGRYIEQAPLERGLLLVNRTPGVSVQGTLAPGRKPKTSSLITRLNARPVLTGSFKMDNYGSTYTGRFRNSLNLSVNNPLGYGSQLQLNGLVSEADLLTAGGFNFTSPNIWNGLRFGVYGSRTVYHLGGAFSSLGERGHANQIGLDLSYPLILQPGELLSARVDFKRNSYQQRTTSVGIEQRSHIYVGELTLDGAYANEAWNGVTSASLSVKRGDLSLDNTAARLNDAVGPNARGPFWVGELRVGQTQPLPWRWMMNMTVSGQMASKNLDGSEKFYLGGFQGVMAYPLDQGGGDVGVLARLRLSHYIPLPEQLGHLRGSLLGQTGTVLVNHSPYPGFNGPNRITLNGLGAGLDYQWSRYVSVRVSYVHQIGPTQAVAGQAKGGEIWSQLSLHF